MLSWPCLPGAQDVIRSYYQSELDSIATIAKAAVDAAKPPLPPKAPAIGEDGQPLPEPPARSLLPSLTLTPR